MLHTFGQSLLKGIRDVWHLVVKIKVTEVVVLKML